MLTNPEIRQGIKEYANWPTIPQLYVNGEFVGGCDIMREMYESGELQQVLATPASLTPRHCRKGPPSGGLFHLLIAWARRVVRYRERWCRPRACESRSSGSTC